MIVENNQIDITLNKENLSLKSLNDENLAISKNILTLTIEEKLEDLSTYADSFSITDDQTNSLHREIICPFCEYIISSIDDKCNHLNSCVGYQVYNYMMNRENPGRSSCNSCGITLLTKNMEKHQKKPCKKSNYRYKCAYCQYDFEDSRRRHDSTCRVKIIVNMIQKNLIDGSLSQELQKLKNKSKEEIKKIVEPKKEIPYDHFEYISDIMWKAHLYSKTLTSSIEEIEKIRREIAIDQRWMIVEKKLNDKEKLVKGEKKKQEDIMEFRIEELVEKMENLHVSIEKVNNFVCAEMQTEKKKMDYALYYHKLDDVETKLNEEKLKWFYKEIRNHIKELKTNEDKTWRDHESTINSIEFMHSGHPFISRPRTKDQELDAVESFYIKLGLNDKFFKEKMHPLLHVPNDLKKLDHWTNGKYFNIYKNLMNNYEPVMEEWSEDLLPEKLKPKPPKKKKEWTEQDKIENEQLMKRLNENTKILYENQSKVPLDKQIDELILSSKKNIRPGITDDFVKSMNLKKIKYLDNQKEFLQKKKDREEKEEKLAELNKRESEKEDLRVEYILEKEKLDIKHSKSCVKKSITGEEHPPEILKEYNDLRKKYQKILRDFDLEKDTKESTQQQKKAKVKKEVDYSKNIKLTETMDGGSFLNWRDDMDLKFDRGLTKYKPLNEKACHEYVIQDLKLSMKNDSKSTKPCERTSKLDN
jgi:transposase-like protein